MDDAARGDGWLAINASHLGEAWPGENARSPEASGAVRLVEPHGWPVLQWAAGGGRWVSLNSGRDPITEAARRLVGADAEGAPTLIVVGLGLGYLLDVLEAAGRQPFVVALEPHADIVGACLGRRDWRGWLDAGRLSFVTGDAGDGLTRLAARAPDALADAAVLVHDVLAREEPDFARRAIAAAGRAIAAARANRQARRAFAGRYLLQTLDNLPRLAREGDVDHLQGLADGVPAVVVGAGPSLDGHLRVLRQLQGRALLIATDTALRPLLAAGVGADIVVSVDPGELNARHLLGLEGPLPWLVAEASLGAPALDAFSGRTFFFRVSQHEPWPWLAAHGVGCGRLRAWGSVVTCAIDLAGRLGCESLVFLGLDLAYTHGRPYARGTTAEAHWARRVAEGWTLPSLWAASMHPATRLSAADLSGASTHTAPHLVAFRDWIVAEAAAGRRRFVNASGAGILAGGSIEQAGLADALRHSHAAAVREATSRIAAAHERAGRRRQVLALPWPAAPLDRWAAFAAESGVAPATVVAAVARVRQALAMPQSTELPDHPCAVPDLDGYPWVAPEALPILNALRLGTEPPPWCLDLTWPAVEAGVGHSGASGVARELAGALDRLVAGRLGGGPVPSTGLLCCTLGLPADVVRAIARVETATAAAVAASGAPTALPSVWRREDLPVAGLSRATCDARSAAGSAPGLSVALALQTVSALASAGAVAVESSPGETAAAQQVMARVTRLLLAAVRQGPGAPLSIDAVPCRVAVVSPGLAQPVVATLPIGFGAMTHALTGAVVARVVDPASLRVSVRVGAGGGIAGAVGFAGLEAAQCRWALARPLEDVPPKALFGITLDAASALFAIAGTSLACRVFADGSVTRDEGWPCVLHGLTSGAHGGAVVAWSRDARCLMLRASRAAAVVALPLPFRPVSALQVGVDVLCLAEGGGLWLVGDGGRSERLAETAPATGLRRHGSEVWFDRVTLTREGFTARLAGQPGYSWDPVSATLATRPVPACADCWSVSDGPHGWQARALPQAGAVELSCAGGATWWLACGWPLCVAWAGATLLVASSTRGDLLRFDALAELLSAEAPTGEVR